MEEATQAVSGNRVPAGATTTIEREVSIPQASMELQEAYAREIAPFLRELEAVIRDRNSGQHSTAVTSWSGIAPLGGENAGAVEPQYRLELAAAWPTSAGARIRVVVEKADGRTRETRGEIIVTDGDAVVVDLTAGEPRVLGRTASGDRVRLATEGAWLERKLHRCLSAIERDAGRLEAGRIARALRTIGADVEAVPALDAWMPASPIPLAKLATHVKADELNEGQIEAVKRACGTGDLHFVVGPPGTGKTSTLAACVCQLLAQGEKVLVLAPTNAAADVALRRIADWCLADETTRSLLGRGLIRRCGPGGRSVRIAGVPLSEDATVGALAEERRRFLGDPMRWSDGRLVSREGGAALVTNSVERIAEWAECPLPTNVAPAQREALLVADDEAFRRAARTAARREWKIAVATTSTPLSSPSTIQGFEAQTSIVDEAGMVGQAHAILCSATAQRRLILFGDPLQFGPVVKSRGSERLRRGGMAPVEDSRTRAGECSRLYEQYRMAKPICNLLNMAFPQGVRLETAPSRLAAARPRWMQHGALVLVDTSSARPTSTKNGGSLLTRAHIELVDRMAMAFHEHVGRCAADGRPVGRPSVGIVCPYRAQRDALVHRVGHAGVTTVHKKQGGEADAIWLCLDECTNARGFFFGRCGGAIDDGRRMLYVGASRAREQLVVVAPVAHLRQHGSDAVRVFLAELAREAECITASEFYR